ncbi:hypothetical protein C2845_PM07G26500 [Panicum miliaceum]|uniref:Uncharacterized protein n=1 Tax=Panicum miliaceum TaxID=4540 RepID=A0A3L6SL94_PANMI|nr:hypothetical protein C2845_PM07G26500 [Panicum miliaceum]
MARRRPAPPRDPAGRLGPLRGELPPAGHLWPPPPRLASSLRQATSGPPPRAPYTAPLPPWPVTPLGPTAALSGGRLCRAPCGRPATAAPPRPPTRGQGWQRGGGARRSRAEL